MLFFGVELVAELSDDILHVIQPADHQDTLRHVRMSITRARFTLNFALGNQGNIRTV